MAVNARLRLLIVTTLLLNVWTFSLNGVVANDGDRTVISAAGVSRISVQPDRVRLAIPLYAHTLSSADSLELIRERKERARQRVRALSCVEDSVNFGSITVETTDEDNRYSASSMRVLGAMGNDLEVDDLPTLITARVDMTADWLLPPGADQEAVLGIVEGVVADLKSQDITGKEARPEFSPQVEEALKQLQIQARSYMSSMNRSNLDEIRYAFVAQPTTDQQNLALRKAVDDAKKQINALAASMDLNLGQPLMINTNSSLSSHRADISHSYGGRSRVDILQPNDDELLSERYTGLFLSARVQMQYSVE